MSGSSRVSEAPIPAQFMKAVHFVFITSIIFVLCDKAN